MSDTDVDTGIYDKEDCETKIVINPRRIIKSIKTVRRTEING